VGIVTALCPLIGYDAACSLAKESLRSRVPVGKLAVERGLLTEEEAETALDPMRMTIIPEE
jgi:aspartate ammonia-lyase